MTEGPTGDEKNEIAVLAGVSPKEVHLYLSGKKQSISAAKAVFAALRKYKDGKYADEEK